MAASIVDRIRACAVELRAALDAADHQALGVQWAHFPRGSCGAAAEVLGRMLRDCLGIEATYVNGSLDRPGGWSSHAWVEFDGIIADITADQFGQAPVIVTRDSAWHRQLTHLERLPLNREGAWWAEHAAAAYWCDAR
jgi:hypothetical protein